MRICMLLHKSVEHDSRVRREARALTEAGHEVTVIHLPRTAGELDGPLDGFTVVSATPRRSLRRRLPMRLYRGAFLWNFVEAIRHAKPDAVHAHDTAMLAPGWIGARLTRSKLVYDTHEYAPGVVYRQRLWAAFVNAVERALIGRCDAVVTVSEGIADRLWKRYRLKQRPTVVRNVPDPGVYDEGVRPPDLRRQLGMDASGGLVLHLGAVAHGRGCATLVRAMNDLPESAELLFLGADDERFVDGLRQAAKECGVDHRTHFRKSVPVAQVLGYVRQASVGVSLLEDICDNHRLALPNKAFEYLQAEIPVVLSDLPEARRTFGSVATLVDARSVHSISEALRGALQTGMRTSPMLRWPDEAARLVAVYGARVV